MDFSNVSSTNDVLSIYSQLQPTQPLNNNQTSNPAQCPPNYLQHPSQQYGQQFQQTAQHTSQQYGQQSITAIHPPISYAQQYPSQTKQYPHIIHPQTQQISIPQNNSNNNNFAALTHDRITKIVDEKLDEFKNVLLNINKLKKNKNAPKDTELPEDEFRDRYDADMRDIPIIYNKEEDIKKQTKSIDKQTKDLIMWTAINYQTAGAIKLSRITNLDIKIIGKTLQFWCSKGWVCSRGKGRGYNLIRALNKKNIDFGNGTIKRLRKSYGAFIFESIIDDDDDDDDEDYQPPEAIKRRSSKASTKVNIKKEKKRELELAPLDNHSEPPAKRAKHGQFIIGDEQNNLSELLKFLKSKNVEIPQKFQQNDDEDAHKDEEKEIESKDPPKARDPNPKPADPSSKPAAADPPSKPADAHPKSPDLPPNVKHHDQPPKPGDNDDGKKRKSAIVPIIK